MKLGALLTAINSELAALVPGVTTHIGPEWLTKGESPPRVVWVPEAERFIPGGVRSIRAPQTAGNTARSLWTNVVVVAAHCWGTSTDPKTTAANEYAEMDAARDLARLLLVAARRAAYGAVTPLPTQHDTSGAQLVQRGRLYVMRLEVRLPVEDYTADRYQTLTVVDEDPTPGTEVQLVPDTEIELPE